MGEARKRGTFEQRVAMAKRRDEILDDTFAYNDLNALDVRAALWRVPMTPEKLATMADKSKRVFPG